MKYPCKCNEVAIRAALFSGCPNCMMSAIRKSRNELSAMTAERDRLAADLAAALERATVAERELEQIAEDAAGEDL